MPSGGHCIDETGKRFGELVVVSRHSKVGAQCVKWLCKCDCGNEYVVRGNDLRHAKTSRCVVCQKKVRTERFLARRIEEGRVMTQAETTRKKKYGMTPSQYNAMWEAQDGKCAICGEPMLTSPYHLKSVVVDHDHNTGRIRALLHNGCNSLLGYAEDNPDVLYKAARYLELNAPSDDGRKE